MQRLERVYQKGRGVGRSILSSVSGTISSELPQMHEDKVSLAVRNPWSVILSPLLTKIIKCLGFRLTRVRKCPLEIHEDKVSLAVRSPWAPHTLNVSLSCLYTRLHMVEA